MIQQHWTKQQGSTCSKLFIKEHDDSQTFKIAYLRLTKHAGLWFDGVKAKRKRQDEPKINTWSQLRKKMRDKYVPYDFDQQNYVRLTSLFQGPMTVSEYIAEFDRLTDENLMGLVNAQELDKKTR